VPVHEFVALSEADRVGKTPFVWTTDDDKHLIKLEVAPTVIHLVEERLKHWRTLQYLAGSQIEHLTASHQIDLENLRVQFKDAVQMRESAIDTIARAMTQLASASGAPGGSGEVTFAPLPAGFAPAAAPAPKAEAGLNGTPLVRITDETKCTNCKTCYQDLSELFERTKIVVNGVTKEVGHVIPGALAKVTVTPELLSRIAKVAANCDAEIIE